MDAARSKMTLTGLAVPVFFESILRLLLGSVAVFMLGHYSDNAVSAVSVAGQIINMVITIYSIVSMGTGIYVAQLLGSEDTAGAYKYSMIAIVLNLYGGIVFSLALFLFSGTLLRLMDLPPSLMADADIYLKIVGGFSFIQAVISSMSVVSRSYGKTKLPLLVAIVMNIVNVIGLYIIIYDPFNINIPKVLGVAVCSVLSQLAAFILMCFLLFKYLNFKFKLKYLIHFQKEEALNIIKIGAPAAMESFSYNLAQIVSTYVITKIGTEALTAKVYVTNITTYLYMFGFSIGQSTQIMIGHLAGANRLEETDKLNNKALKITIVSGVFFAVVAALFGKQLIGIFTNDAAVIKLAAGILYINILLEAGRSFNLIEVNALRGVGDVKYVMVFAVLSAWLVSVTFSFLLGINLSLGLSGVWIAFALDEWFRGLNLFRRWKSNKWKKNLKLITNAKKP